MKTKTKEKKLNVKLLRRIIKKIKQEPLQFDMSDWFRFGEFRNGVKIPNCGTAACIAGWAITLNQRIQQPAKAVKVFHLAMFNEELDFDAKDTYNDYSRNTVVANKAATILGISKDQANNLFNVANWPEKFIFAYCNTKDHMEKVNIACERIEFFIKTNGTDH